MSSSSLAASVWSRATTLANGLASTRGKQPGFCLQAGLASDESLTGDVLVTFGIVTIASTAAMI